jgi:hypothetical protein
MLAVGSFRVCGKADGEQIDLTPKPVVSRCSNGPLMPAAVTLQYSKKVSHPSGDRA